MKVYKAEAIVIRTRKYGEADSLLTLYSRERGKIDAIAKGVRKLKSSKRGGVQLFTHGHFLLYEGRNLHTVTQCEAIDSFLALSTDLVKMTYATYISELVDGFAVAGEGSDIVFALILVTFNLLAAYDDPELVVRAFEIRLMDIMGYSPQLQECCNCHNEIKGPFRFSARLGGLLCGGCLDNDPYALQCNMGSIKVLQQLQRIDLRRLNILKVSSEIKSEIEKLMQEYLKLRVERKIKSVDFLKQLKNYI